MAGIHPLEVKIVEITKSYETTKATRTLLERKQAKNLARQSATKTFKKMLNEIPRGEWTREFIQELDAWINYQHGQLTFHLMQLLCGHDAFQKYYMA